MYLAGSSFNVGIVVGAWPREPRYFCRYAITLREGVGKTFADVLGAADAVEEAGLEEAGDANHD